MCYIVYGSAVIHTERDEKTAIMYLIICQIYSCRQQILFPGFMPSKENRLQAPAPHFLCTGRVISIFSSSSQRESDRAHISKCQTEKSLLFSVPFVLTASSGALVSSSISVLIAFFSLRGDNYNFQLDLLYIMLKIHQIKPDLICNAMWQSGEERSRSCTSASSCFSSSGRRICDCSSGEWKHTKPAEGQAANSLCFL